MAMTRREVLAIRYRSFGIAAMTSLVSIEALISSDLPYTGHTGLGFAAFPVGPDESQK
ncbi:MAG TPA: hypothetical protein VFA81_13460 [Burkholderiales bacterium]|nr:hypothetical protein [Burkholderiales bacterium]